jgi:hypothetical protein
MRERRYKYTVWGGPLRQAQGPGSCTVSELAELAVRFRDRGSFGTVSELAELAVISCARVKDTTWILKPRMELRIREVDFKAGARSKVANGVVAVGLPHRNYSVFKQTPYQLIKSKSGGG